MDVEKIRDDIRDIRIFTGRYFPFIVIPLSYMRIIASETIPAAGVDEQGTLAVNPNFWQSLDVSEKRYVAIHETLHVTLCHPFRMKGFNRLAYNYASDGKVNHAIEGANVQGVSLRSKGKVTLNVLATVTKLRVEDLEKMSTEEIARLLEKCGEECGCKTQADGDLISGTLNGEVVQEGSEKVKGCDGEALRDVWKRICERAATFAKQAGSFPAALERVVEEVLEVKPPWHITLRFGLRNGSKTDSSFAYLNRRSDDLPGPIGYAYSVWCLVDTSGSISEAGLMYFLGIVKHEARRAKCFVIPWDAQSYEVLRADKPADVARKVARKMKGGGGTVVEPALEKVFTLMKPGDAVVVLTDGEIFDESKNETQEWFRRVSAKAGFAMIGYTFKPVYAPGFYTSRLGLHQSTMTLRTSSQKCSVKSEGTYFQNISSAT